MVFTTWLTARASNGASLQTHHYSLSSTVLSVHSFAHIIIIITSALLLPYVACLYTQNPLSVYLRYT